MGTLPPGFRFFERGWLSSNMLLLLDEDLACLVDSGYCTHAPQTLALVQHALGSRPLDRLLNTHLHSDHCGGNAALQAAYPGLRTSVPPGEFAAVQRWDTAALSFEATGQACPRFTADDMLVPGSRPHLGGRRWEVHASPGHDPHSVILFEPEARVLVSADALWQNGFGVVFPELAGEPGFADIEDTLDLIESLQPTCVLPGHGQPFSDVAGALAKARARLQGLRTDPRRHGAHAAKVLIKFKLLEQRSMALPALHAWAAATPYLEVVRSTWFAGEAFAAWIDRLLAELAAAGALQHANGWVANL